MDCNVVMRGWVRRAVEDGRDTTMSVADIVRLRFCARLGCDGC